ncbi:carbohydrate-binding domain-containing protein [Cellulomonas soli]
MSVVVGGGTLLVDAADDAVHSAGVVSVTDGVLTLASGDDGIHADNALQITGGAVEITDSYEGLEAAQITVAGGDVSVVAVDDGLNAASSTEDATEDTSGDAAAGPGGEMATDANALVTIAGGTLLVDAQGDGLDSNGSMVMTGGTVVVSGPTNAGNGALDYNGTFEISGGELIAVGSSGMAQTPSDGSTQSFVGFTLSSTQGDGSVVHVLDADGTVVASFEATKEFSSVVYSSADITSGEEYTLTVGGTVGDDAVHGLSHSGDADGATSVGTATAGTVIAGMGGGMGGAGGGAGGGGRQRP